MKALPTAAAFVSVFAALATASPADAKQVCGWYAIAYCSTSQSAVGTFANKGWGAVIDTNNFRGFARGQFCAVSGPQPKWSAASDREKAIAASVSKSVYIKRACADEKYTGD